VILEPPAPRITSLAVFSKMRWLDGRKLLDCVEPYRQRIFTSVLDERDALGRPRYNLALTGRAKKNWKSADLVLAALYALLAGAPGGAQCYLLANDEEQAGDDLELAKKIVEANGAALADRLAVKQKIIQRLDGRGFLEILPARDVVGTHGKTYRFAGFDEIHGYRDWDLLEAMQLDPTRPEAQMWITTYASIHHRPGVPLFDLLQRARGGQDPRLFFSWYAADFTTDSDFADADPETRANPSRSTWSEADYLPQQQRRLPAHKYRRLHLNLPGLPEGSAFQPEPVMAAIDRGVSSRPPEAGRRYVAFVDMSGGSSDDAVLAIAHREPDGSRVLDLVLNQGPAPPFDPRQAIKRFARALAAYWCASVTGDAFGGETFREDFRREGFSYRVAEPTTSELYEGLEPILNAGELRLLDAPKLEQELLGLVWRGGKITHPGGEHDDWATAVAGVVSLLGRHMRPEAGVPWWPRGAHHVGRPAAPAPIRGAGHMEAIRQGRVGGQAGWVRARYREGRA
jgi:hypothetical protein